MFWAFHTAQAFGESAGGVVLLEGVELLFGNLLEDHFDLTETRFECLQLFFH